MIPFLRRHRHRIWLLLGLYWLVLFTATHLPPAHLPNAHFNDKVEHVAAFGLLTGALYVSLWSVKRPAWRIAAIVLPIVLIYGALDEQTQPLTGRTCDLRDWYADTVGAVGAVTVMVCWDALSRPARHTPA